MKQGGAEMGIITEEAKKEFNRILLLINSGEIGRMGKLFTTELNNYFYDTGTGKVICIDDTIYYIMNMWFNKINLTENEINEMLHYSDSLEEVLQVCKNENLLRAEKPQTLHSYKHCDELNETLQTGLEQLILEVTGCCNLRCKYCIYNEEYDVHRDFNEENMTEEIAMRSIDYFLNHARKDAAVTFYGGEPLLRFELLKKVIEYSRKRGEALGKNITFSLTTNMTLVTEDIAEYLGSIPELHLLCSMDGPQIVQDSCRIYKNGRGSFDDALRGLKLLSSAFRKYGKKFRINAVFTPEYSFKKLDLIEEFFNSLEFLPPETSVDITYPSEGSFNSDLELKKLENNPKYLDCDTGDINPLWKWKKIKLREEVDLETKKSSLVKSGLDQTLSLIDQRFLAQKPNKVYPLNACCVPGERRLYVDTQGSFYPCERIGNCPSIGNVNIGLDVEAIKKYYVDDFIEKSISKCSNCWAIRLCTLCYANRYVAEGFEPNENACCGTRLMIQKKLSLYHELLETRPKDMKFLEDVEIV